MKARWSMVQRQHQADFTWRWLLLTALLTFSALQFPVQAEKRADALWSSSVVTIEVARKQYDYYQPWSKPMRQVQKMGTVIAGHQVLTTANDLFDRTLVRLQKRGRGRWWIGEVVWIDYHANLALITTGEADFWDDLKAVSLERTAAPRGRIQILRWWEGSLESRGAEFTRFTVRDGQLSQVNHVALEAASEIQGAGLGEPVIADSHVLGFVSGQEGRTCVIIPVSFAHAILEARKKGRFTGLGYFHFIWQRAENPASLEFLKLTGRPRGVIVMNVPPRPDGGEQTLQVRDIILQIDGFDIDTHGDCDDPEFGHVMLENLSTRSKWAGDTFKIQIWRDGKPMDVSYQLPKFAYTNSLVPAAIYDREPEYVILGGLVFQPLTGAFLQIWGPDWRQQAPFRLNYYTEQSPSKERPSLVLLSQVLPDDYNIGYQEQHGLVVEKVNGQPIGRLSELRDALQKPVNGFHVIEFALGDSLQRIVLAAGDPEKEANRRVLERYGIAESFRLLPEAGERPDRLR